MTGLQRLDRIDIKILAQLQQNGRMSNVDLAHAVGLSASPCLQRVKRLDAAGYISGYGARINLAKFGDLVTVFTQVTLQDHRKDDFVKFESQLRRIIGLVECHLVSGGYDYLLKFMVPSIQVYQDIIENLLEKQLGINKYFSFIVIKSPIVRDHLPIDELATPKAR